MAEKILGIERAVEIIDKGQTLVIGGAMSMAQMKKLVYKGTLCPALLADLQAEVMEIPFI
jgi:hypothetical protein